MLDSPSPVRMNFRTFLSNVSLLCGAIFIGLHSAIIGVSSVNI